MSRVPTTIELVDEAATAALGEDIAAALTIGDAVALAGPLGAGKTTLARAILRALHDDPELEVPSPTFTLVQSYDGGRLPVAHLDLYRIGAADELAEIGLDEALDGGAALIEWPERAVGALSESRLTVTLTFAGDGRSAELVAAGGIAERIERSLAIRQFLNNAGWAGAERRHLQGDASTRAFERIAGGPGRAVLMDAPRRPDGPPIRDNLPYSRIAHLAESGHAFVAVAGGLGQAGFSAPAIRAADLDAGLVLMEDLGAQPVVADGVPIAERYRVAVELLAALHGSPRPVELPLPDGAAYRLPDYDRGALAIETSLMIDWYVPFALGGPAGLSLTTDFTAAWDALFDRLAGTETGWVLRDYHSPNLIWCPERQGVRRIGLVDFQDALIGPTAYDVASLLQDARVSVPPELEAELLAHYLALREAGGSPFDRDAFRTAYAIMAAQRATKVLGIFVRLARRDGKPVYLGHLPRIHAYLARTLTDPALADLRKIYEALPEPAA